MTKPYVHEIEIAGQVWRVADVRLDRDASGRTVIALDQIDRVLRAVANRICGSSDPLTVPQFEALCEIVEVPYARIAEQLDQTRGALTRWMGKGEPMKRAKSDFVKRWFWQQLFLPALAEECLPLGVVLGAGGVEAVSRLAVARDVVPWAWRDGEPDRPPELAHLHRSTAQPAASEESYVDVDYGLERRARRPPRPAHRPTRAAWPGRKSRPVAVPWTSDAGRS